MGLFVQQSADHLFGVVVTAFTDVPVTDTSLSVDQVHGRPGPVVPGVPVGISVIHRDRISDTMLKYVAAQGIGIAFEGEFRRVDADHRQPLVTELFVPGLDVRFDMAAVTAAEGPEFDQQHAAVLVGSR